MSSQVARISVYPRVGGGTRSTNLPARALSGLSPRGRGNRRAAGRACADRGSIPAWAGEPTTNASGEVLVKVYPRVGGGTHSSSACRRVAAGLSPRGRGNREHQPGVGRPDGSIPAWAGEPLRLLCFDRVTSVYPRVGGGTRTSDGEPVHRVGLSPRGRGNQDKSALGVLDAGSIPAWAGEPIPLAPVVESRRVYPRVGGGTGNTSPELGAQMGLSPRGRGNPCAYSVLTG